MVHGLNQAVFRTNISKCSLSWIYPVFRYVSHHVSDGTLREKHWIISNCESEISNACNAVDGHCRQAMKNLHHHANGCFDWLISEHQSVNPWREEISILSRKYKRFTFVHPVVKD